MRIPKSLAVLSLTLVVTGSTLGQAKAQTGEVGQGHDQTPCTLKEEPINDDGSLRKPQRLLDLEQQHDAAPMDDAVTKELAAELLSLAQYMMYCSRIAPRQKYPLAYCLYSQVLRVDKENKVARESAEMIESIYDQIGRPRPSGECP